MTLVKQLSVMVENRVGRLAEVTGTIGEAGANILGFSIAEGENFGIVRFILDRTDEAYAALKGNGHTVSCSDVIALPIEDNPGGLHRVAARCAQLGVNIAYAYAFRKGDGAVLVLKADDALRSISLLKGDGFQPLDKKDLV